ncbi:hypothetical protein [Spirosoma sordidisoli]|uniref:Uncharacterized protein n=1 Tax=Spirosoma sordidisoli TaxID=2502893 RepID=A0A4Q2UGS2_9BACT|nr:hypothetical protein [Spirosoma sordidisoli]RYC68216.1 hypothetical protein EQG79_22475 [Spirosoma sordidisoli]
MTSFSTHIAPSLTHRLAVRSQSRQGRATVWTRRSTTSLIASQRRAYQVLVSVPGLTTGCVAYTTLRSKPCRQVAHTYQCGTAPAATIGNPNDPRLSNRNVGPLAPGDTIRTGDFDVIVMTVSGGSSGWTGTGYTEIPYLKNTRLAVELKGALVNDCYELVGGTIVSAYDPNWGGLTDLTGTVNLLKDAVTQLVDLYANYTGTQAERDKLSALNAQLCARINDNDKLPADQKASLLADCQAYQAASASFTACYAATHPPSVTAAPGGRMAALTTTNQECTAPKDALDQLTARINGIDQSVETDKNDIQIKNRVILQKGDTLLIDDLKIVFKSPYKADYSKETGLIVSTPSSATAYGVAFEKATGRFTGFYRLDYLVSPLPTTTPCTTTSRTIGYENKPGFKACEEGFLQEGIYQELYEAYPANTLSGSSLNLLTQRPQGKDPLWTGSENGYTLKLFVTDQTTTPQNRVAIAKAANKPGPTDIHLWIDYGANGQIRYEYIYGTHITAKKPASLARFFEAWLQKIRPAPSMGAENPIAQVIAGVANLVGATQIPGKYWNCDSTRYVQLPWISDASGAPAYLTAREDWAFQCGLYNGTVNVVGGLPLLFNMLIDEQQRAQLWSELKQLKDIELSDKTVTNVFQLVYNPAQQCVTSYNRGYTVPTVFSLFVGIGELNLLGKAKSAISTLTSMARKLPAVGVGIRKAAVAGTLVLGMTTSAGAFQNLPATLRAITTTVQSAVKITGRFEQLTDDVAATANGLAATGNRGVLKASELTVEGLTKPIAAAEDLVLFKGADKLVIGTEIINEAQQKTFSALAFFSAVGGLVTTYVNTNPSTNNCSICTGRAMPTSLCTKLSTVRSRGGANGRAGVEKLCRSIPDNTRLEAITDRILLFTDNAEVTAFLGDIQGANCGSTDLCGNVENLTTTLVGTWDYLYQNQISKAPYARKYWVTLTNFTQLNQQTVQPEIVKFSDSDSRTSTLKEFSDDLANTAGFINFLNDNADFVKGFVGHKQNPLYQPSQYEELIEALKDIPVNNAVELQVKGWLAYSREDAQRQDYYTQGRNFENYVLGQLQSSSSAVYQRLKTGFIPDLDQRQILSQVQFCINSNAISCTNKGQYFIADFVFIKQGRDPITNALFWDIIVADTKLKSTTGFTTNQRNAINQGGYKLKAPIDRDIKGLPFIFTPSQPIIKSQPNFLKIFSNGSGGFGDVTN